MKKKEFAKVQKKISDQMNRYADKIIVGQYTGEKEPKRKEGEFWKDRDGKQWTLKGGVKQSISPLQDAKTPWWCPKCEKIEHRISRPKKKHDFLLSQFSEPQTQSQISEKGEVRPELGLIQKSIMQADQGIKCIHR